MARYSCFYSDVNVNWFYGGSSGKRIPNFWEWKKDDDIEFITSTHVVRVSKELFDYISNGFGRIPNRLFEELIPGYIKSNAGRREVEGLFVMSTGEECLAVLTEGNREPLLKSHLTLRNTDRINDLAKKLDELPARVPILMHKVEDEDFSFEGNLVTLKNEYFIGLTRREIVLKELLFDCLFEMACEKEERKTRYLFVECFSNGDTVQEASSLSQEEMLTRIHSFLKVGWSERHFEFGRQLANMSDLFRDIWEDESKVNDYLSEELLSHD